MGEIKLVRIDSRLSHGKVVKVWTKELGVDTVVIANDKVSSDDFRKKVMDLTIPDNINRHYLPVKEVGEFVKKLDKDIFLIVENARDLEIIASEGLDIPTINIGIIHMSEGKKSLTEEVAVDEDDLRIFKDFMTKGSEVYLRLSPYAQKIDLTSMFKKEND
ncbi:MULTISPECIES: PTS system mannose/fructose/N-acetylgalactosamine-transporter subunit IIB [Anaerococcus]|uniref:PTS system sorbose subfamily IIB component n=1 Tax=Anaerococcus prevotii ACS-065-V-Col13 TaxID=879305 RepID=F0GX68_9FIRM|nr:MULTISPECIES: PTS sugar transporter subunit IIB [Anaerococcus]EGC81565.1 PTS system sorbose subfamily IIB component [Anaerococcus prevotii ACS-065-V-Col13]